MRTLLVLALAVALAGCEKNLLNGVPDAADGAPDVRVDTGDFSCATTPWPTSAPDLLSVSGQLMDAAGSGGLVGVNVDVRAVATDQSLAVGVTGGTGSGAGLYSTEVTTGGAAPTIYRKVSASGYLDFYFYDATPEYNPDTFYRYNLQSSTTYWQSIVGLGPDPTKGVAVIVVLDCGRAPNDVALAGATIEVPAGAKVLYVDDTAPYTNPNLTATSSLGQAVLFNLDPGEYSIIVRAGLARNEVTYRAWPMKVYANSWTVSYRKP